MTQRYSGLFLVIFFIICLWGLFLYFVFAPINETGENTQPLENDIKQHHDIRPPVIEQTPINVITVKGMETGAHSESKINVPQNTNVPPNINVQNIDKVTDNVPQTNSTITSTEWKKEKWEEGTQGNFTSYNYGNSFPHHISGKSSYWYFPPVSKNLPENENIPNPPTMNDSNTDSVNEDKKYDDPIIDNEPLFPPIYNYPGDIDNSDVPIVTVPEPGVLPLFIVGLIFMLSAKHKSIST